jgi:hypothetical protein
MLNYLPFISFISGSIFFYLFFLFGLRGYRHCGHSWPIVWPIVPASGDNEEEFGEHDGM